MTAATGGRKRGQLNPGEVGTMGEDAVFRLLRQQGKRPVDVRDDNAMRRRDIDFVLNDGATVEVKTDTWLGRTGNLFFEVLRDHGKAGCFLRSKADYWYYVDAEGEQLHIFRLSEAQAWLMANPRAEWLTTTRSHRRTSGQSGFVEFVGYKVPLDTFRQHVDVTTLALAL